MKKIILCPNPSRDREMVSTRSAMEILLEMGFETVVCSPFKEQRPELFAGINVKPLTQELRSSDLLVTFGGHSQAAGLGLRPEDLPAFRKNYR